MAQKDLHGTGQTEHDRGVSQNVSENRGVAARVARLLVQKDRPEDAVALLSAWAARGPNDPAGQGLLAEALRINPAAKAAQQAFERMEGIGGQHTELDAAIQKFDAAEVERLQKALETPTFKRAQIGFNNNIRAKDQVFHIQTEDSGLSSPHIITHLFADGGRVVKSHKRIYAAAVDTEPDIGAYVRQLMKAQHLEMVLQLREGRFDDILAGKAVGGMEVLEHYPDGDMSKLGGKAGNAPAKVSRAGGEAVGPAVGGADPATSSPNQAAAAPRAQLVRPESAAAQKSAVSSAQARAAREVRGPAVVPTNSAIPIPASRPAPQLYTLHVLRSLGGGPGRYAV